MPILKHSAISSLNIPTTINQHVNRIYIKKNHQEGEKGILRIQRILINSQNKSFELKKSDFLSVNYISEQSKRTLKAANKYLIMTNKERSPWVEIILNKKVFIKDISIFSVATFNENDLKNLTIKTFLDNDLNFECNLSGDDANIKQIDKFIQNNIQKTNYDFFNHFSKSIQDKNKKLTEAYVIDHCETYIKSCEEKNFRLDYAMLMYSTFELLPRSIYEYILITLIINKKKKDVNILINKYAKSLKEKDIQKMNSTLMKTVKRKNWGVITSHGIAKSSLKDIDKHHLVKFMKEISTIFHENNYDLIVCYGTLLGIYRDNMFIPYDDDLDMLILTDKNEDLVIDEVKKSLVPILTNKGYESKFLKTKHTHFFHIKDKTKTRLDIFIGQISSNAVNLPMEKVMCREIEKNIMLPIRKISFLGEDFYAPNNIEGFLEERYGSNWRIPNRMFRFQEKSIRQENFLEIN
jgi:phosphorylcholine metabolism protein LicD